MGFPNLWGEGSQSVCGNGAWSETASHLRHSCDSEHSPNLLGRSCSRKDSDPATAHWPAMCRHEGLASPMSPLLLQTCPSCSGEP